MKFFRTAQSSASAFQPSEATAANKVSQFYYFYLFI